MNSREKRKIRKCWRECTRKRRQQAKQAAEQERNLQNFTPPLSENEDSADDNILINPLPREIPNVERQESSQKKRGRKLVRRDRAAAYRKIQHLQTENVRLRRLYEKYKKRASRALDKKIYKAPNELLTPKSKVTKMLRNVTVPKQVRKRLLFAEVITHELGASFKKLKSQKEKQLFTKVLGGKVVKKYRLLTHAQPFLPKKLFLSNKRRLNVFSYERLQSKNKTIVIDTVNKFWENEEHTTTCPGKKDFLKRNGIKKQKHYMNDTLKNLHGEFLKKNEMYISYSLFCKIKPFWVIAPNVNERDTCLCLRHENFKLYTQKLNKLKVIKESTPRDIVNTLTCKKKTESCFKRTCPCCVNNNVLYQEFNFEQPVQIKRWIKKKEQRISAKKKEITVKLTVKEPLECTLGEIVVEYEAMQGPFLNHVMNIRHQFQSMNLLKKSLSENYLFLHVDFSENYCCKYSEEPQGVHFGASRPQVSLHTGVAYSKNHIQGFCTLSSSLQHNSEAIIAHMKPIIQHFLDKFPNVNTLHFLSDSPSNQYRNKTMFLMINSRIPELFPTIQNITWNYSEAGHGKGAPDGIGGVLKRVADRVVAGGQDISNFDTLFDTLQEKTENILLMKIDSEDIQEEFRWVQSWGDQNQFAVKGCLKVHQVCWERKTGNIMFRTLSCLSCGTDIECKHYHLTTKTFKHTSNMNDFEFGGPEINAYGEDEEHPEDEPLEQVVDLQDVQAGIFVLVKVEKVTRNEVCKFVAVCESELDDKGEVDVLFLKSVGGSKQCFKTVDNDRSVIHYTDLIKVLPPPNLILRGDRIVYKFDEDIDIWET